jgi:catechol 2,3-dioxygenase-like lactoylglutathione lyase family enzyme
MKITRILHHSVNVEGDLAACVDFYRRLSLVDTPRPEIPGVAGHWFAIERAQVHLVDAPAGESRIRPTGPHVCLGVENLEGAVAELEGEDIPFVRGWQGDVEQIWVADPMGNTIELQQDPDFTVPPPH